MLMNVINEMKEKQNDLEINSNVVINQNKDILLQNEFLLKEIKSKMIQDTENFYILGCYEFEMLCQHANKKNLNLKNALDDLMAERTEIYSIEFLDKIYLDFFHNLMD